MKSKKATPEIPFNDPRVLTRYLDAKFEAYAGSKDPFYRLEKGNEIRAMCLHIFGWQISRDRKVLQKIADTLEASSSDTSDLEAD